MYILAQRKTWRIFKKACSLILLFTFISYGLPLEGYASDSTNYRLAGFVFNGSNQKHSGPSYAISQTAFGETASSILESASIRAQTGFLPIIDTKENRISAPTEELNLSASSSNFIQDYFSFCSALLQGDSTNFKTVWASLGEPVGGAFSSYQQHSFTGPLCDWLNNPPLLKRNIPAQSWIVNTSKTNALDLDDYFFDPDAQELSYTVSGNLHIAVEIDPHTHQLSLLPGNGFTGEETIIITAFDPQGNRLAGNPVTLNVYDSALAINNAPILEYIAALTAKEGELVSIPAQAIDSEGDVISYSFSAPFNQQGQWQSDYQSAGVYDITVSASDGSLSDAQKVQVTILNVNRRPSLNYLADVFAEEGQLIRLLPVAVDPDNDQLTYSFSAPFNQQGQWQSGYRDSGLHRVTVTVCDGNLSDSQELLVHVANVNTTPTVSISLDRINAAVDEEITFTVTASDPNDDSLNLSLQKDATQFYSGPIYDFHLGRISFSSLGTHTISAAIDDNHGGWAQALSNVEIIQPQQLWNKILPLLGDFNADGLADIGTYNRNSGNWSVALSNPGGFGSITQWLTDFGALGDWQYVNGDFNGDAKTDIAIFNYTNGQWQVAISDGFSFTAQAPWANFPAGTSDAIPITGDFNGDGISDIGAYNKANGEIKCALAQKNSFSAATVWINGFVHSAGAQPFTGDFNGDGLIDIGVFIDGAWSFALSSGKAFIPQGQWAISFGAGVAPVISDFNNDGLTDIGSFDQQSGSWQAYFSNGNGFVSAGAWLNNFGQGEGNTVYALDFNGDGLTDAAVFNNSNFSWQRSAARGYYPDLLKKMTNPLGGTTEISYQSSVYYDNTGDDDFCDLPFAMQTVSAVKQVDGLGNVYQTAYTYAGGVYVPQERETRGFGYVQVMDAQRNISQTWFNQDDLFKGLPGKTRISDAYGNLYAETEKTYDYTQAWPGCTFTYLVQEQARVYEGQITPQISKTAYQYDEYGNPTLITAFGDVDLTGDERFQHTQYNYDTSSWIIAQPACLWLEDSLSQKLSQSWYDYDQRGNLIKQQNYLDTSAERLSTVYDYDEYGNVVAVTDARGNTVSTQYDDQYHTFVKTVTNALGHKVEYTYDPGSGQVLSITDANGQISANQYDVFGRLIKTFGPNDDPGHPGAWYEYDLSLFPARVTTYSRSQHNSDAVDSILVSYAFYDGLGRLIQSKTLAEEPDRQIVRDLVKFNSRGLVSEKYFPYSINISTEEQARSFSAPDYSGAKVSFEYDCLGRTVKTTSLDDAGEQISVNEEYYPRGKITYDTFGHKTRYAYNAYAELIAVEEFNGGQIYTTHYQYDTQGNLTRTIDNQGNATSITYDSLGRKISMDDPDMGIWSYEYDAVGNLIKQTDAKGQILEFRYDELNRLTKKMGLSLKIPEGDVPIFLAEYHYDETTKPHSIGRLSKVIDQSGSTEFFYDNLGREIKSIKTIDAKSYTVERAYDALDRLISLTYPNNEVAGYTYNRQGGIETVRTSQGAVSNVDYTETNQIKLVQNSNGTQTDYIYNPHTLRLQHLLTRNSDFMIQDLSYSFNDTGNVSTITDNSLSGTNTQAFQYDDLNRLIGATGRTYGTISYQYDSIGNLVRKQNQVMDYGQGGAGPHAVTSVEKLGTVPEGPRRGCPNFSLTYDANGNMISKGTTEYQYDIENRLTQVSVASQPQDGQEQSMSIELFAGWNLVGIPLELSDYSCVSVLSSIAGKYDQVSRYNTTAGKFESFVNNPKFDEFSQFSFGEGFLIHMTQNCSLNITGNYPLDAIRYPLKFGWNLIAAPIADNDISTETALKNLVQGTDYTKIYAYNGTAYINNPATLKSGQAYYIYALGDCAWEIPAPTGKQITKFTYDGDGGRVKKSTVHGQQSAETTYIGSLYEENSTGNKKCHIYLGSNKVFTVDYGPLAVDCYFIHTDHLGSSNIITDSTGSIAQLLEYTPFGLTNRMEGEYNTNYRFTGQLFDSSSGLYYYGARYYDPQIGRFTQPDTMIQAPYDPQSFNRYAYCRNNPVNYIDPTGHFFWIAAIIGAIVGGISAHQAGGDVVKGALIGAVVGVATVAIAGGALSYMNNIALASGGVITAAENALTTGIEFAIGGFGTGLVSGYAGGEGSASDMFKSAGIGAATGLITGAVIGYSYQAGWQSFIHGNDSKSINTLYEEAELSLKLGNFERYSSVSRELMKLNIKPPSAVLIGYSKITGEIDHTFLVAVKQGVIKARGFNPHPSFKGFASLGNITPGVVSNEINTLKEANLFRFLTSDIGKINSVWLNMDKVKIPWYQVHDKFHNCYGWRNAVLQRSGIESPNDLPWIH